MADDVQVEAAASTPAASPAPVASAPPVQARTPSKWAEWLPSRTQLLVLVLAVLAASNVALWVTLQGAGDTKPVTVVAVRQMTQDYVRKITTPQLSEQESVARANLFLAAAQEELQRLIPTTHLVLARECVLSGTMNDITPQLEKMVETKLAADTSGLSDTVGSVQPDVVQAGQQILNGPVSSGKLLSAAAASTAGQ